MSQAPPRRFTWSVTKYLPKRWSFVCPDSCRCEWYVFKKDGAGAGITWSNKKLVAFVLLVSKDESNSSICFLADEGKDQIKT